MRPRERAIKIKNTLGTSRILHETDNFLDLDYKEATAKANLELCLKEEKLCVKCYLVRSRLQMSTRDTNLVWNLLPAKRGPCNHERRHKRVYSLPLITAKRFKNSLIIMHHAAKAT